MGLTLFIILAVLFILLPILMCTSNKVSHTILSGDGLAVSFISMCMLPGIVLAAIFATAIIK